MPTYTYLAPLNAATFPRKGDILRFMSDSLPLFPIGNEAYGREVEWGTAIKLYEYEATGFRSHILRHDGLLYRLDILLPDVALPLRLHECRANYKGHVRSFDTPLTGLSVRLDDDKAGNLEDGFPSTVPFSVSGQPMTATVYAFKRRKADTYRKNEGIIFTVNGQTHGHLTRSFFSRRSVGMNRLEDSILVIVDCSQISWRDDLFMNSRDRLRNGEFRREVEQDLESIIKDHQGLRDLRERRRREDVESKLQDSRPMREVLQSILKKSPSLAALFAMSGPLPNPFRTKAVVVSDKPVQVKRYPTYFKFRRLDYGEELTRETPINSRSRIVFETDVENEYFGRRMTPGTFALNVLMPDTLQGPARDYTLTLENGTATLNLRLPSGCSEGDIIRYEAIVRDRTLIEPFVNRFSIKVKPAQEPSGGRSRPRKTGKGEENGHQRENPQGLAIPDPIPVYEEQWERHGFDQYSALKVVHDPADDEDSVGAYTYYVNMDNIYFKSELKATKQNVDIVKTRWQFGLMLLGMALLRDEAAPNVDSNGADPHHTNEEDEEITTEEKVFRTTKAIAAVLLPLIEYLGTLSEEEVMVPSFAE